jgi:hypothetical protein
MGLLFSRRRAPARPVRRARLSLEFLEHREQPSDFFLPTTQDPNTPVYGVGEEGTFTDGEAPVIQNFTATSVGNGTYYLTGQVSSAQPGGLVVTFGGGITGMDGVTTTTDANGYFSVTVTIGAGELGTVTATTVDSQGQLSATVSRVVTSE